MRAIAISCPEGKSYTYSEVLKHVAVGYSVLSKISISKLPPPPAPPSRFRKHHQRGGAKTVRDRGWGDGR